MASIHYSSLFFSDITTRSLSVTGLGGAEPAVFTAAFDPATLTALPANITVKKSVISVGVVFVIMEHSASVAPAFVLSGASDVPPVNTVTLTENPVVAQNDISKVALAFISGVAASRLVTS